MVYLLISNLITVTSVIIAYNLGLRNQQKINNREEIDVVPKAIAHPFETLKRINEEKENKKELERLNTIYENLENYDGTSTKQREVI